MLNICFLRVAFKCSLCWLVVETLPYLMSFCFIISKAFRSDLWHCLTSPSKAWHASFLWEWFLNMCIVCHYVSVTQTPRVLWPRICSGRGGQYILTLAWMERRSLFSQFGCCCFISSLLPAPRLGFIHMVVLVEQPIPFLSAFAYFPPFISWGLLRLSLTILPPLFFFPLLKCSLISSSHSFAPAPLPTPHNPHLFSPHHLVFNLTSFSFLFFFRHSPLIHCIFFLSAVLFQVLFQRHAKKVIWLFLWMRQLRKC